MQGKILGVQAGDDERLLSPRELADRYSIPVQTVYVWRMNNKGPRGFQVGRHVRYRHSEVLAWEQSQLDKEHA
ncbi:hypothetical protein AHiyo8_49030 [Arthrobacter sp. Hiyo8]|uniref:helix-turn-helix transcriptional regulator n=1 Tax=Arthrobacter sp. Hiyo1 TaxID=1588020 RepID=UPI0006839951|nr:helix-turn-helix domain-containing protein [Arthrobacter sp. Hiyo1]BAS16600.1 hypothetical protein AHiyo8_49030 [Arthrobacter sp. Hiyo8]GAP57328.1 hypothetical protein AHiyo1_01600 [Arthrobacter sp. Hiyo1]